MLIKYSIASDYVSHSKFFLQNGSFVKCKDTLPSIEIPLNAQCYLALYSSGKLLNISERSEFGQGLVFLKSFIRRDPCSI